MIYRLFVNCVKYIMNAILNIFVNHNSSYSEPYLYTWVWILGLLSYNHSKLSPLFTLITIVKYTTQFDTLYIYLLILNLIHPGLVLFPLLYHDI